MLVTKEIAELEMGFLLPAKYDVKSSKYPEQINAAQQSLNNNFCWRASGKVLEFISQVDISKYQIHHYQINRFSNKIIQST